MADTRPQLPPRLRSCVALRLPTSNVLAPLLRACLFLPSPRATLSCLAVWGLFLRLLCSWLVVLRRPILWWRRRFPRLSRARAAARAVEVLVVVVVAVAVLGRKTLPPIPPRRMPRIRLCDWRGGCSFCAVVLRCDLLCLVFFLLWRLLNTHLLDLVE